jgi:hypothetical protein
MSPTDIGIFEMLAAVFTLSFIALVFFIWRFIRNLDLARTPARMGGAPTGSDQGRRSVLPDLERGAIQFRVHGTEAPSKDESLSHTGL